MKYQLTITSEQCRTIRDALELFSRLHMGQGEYVGEVLGLAPRESREINTTIRMMGFPGLPCHSYYGITSINVPISAKRAFDLQQVLRYRQSWAEQPPLPGTLRGVNYDEPLPVSGEPLAVVEVADGE